MANYMSLVGSASQKIMLWAIFFLITVFVLILLWAIYYFMTYKNRAVIYDAERKLSAKIVRFKILYKQGVIKFFKPHPNKMLVPQADVFVPFRRSASFFAAEQNGEFFMPLKVTPNPGFLVDAGDFAALKHYHVQDARETEVAYAKKQSVLLQMAPWAAFMVLAIIFLIIVILVFKNGGGAISSAAKAAGQVIPGV